MASHKKAPLYCAYRGCCHDAVCRAPAQLLRAAIAEHTGRAPPPMPPPPRLAAYGVMKLTQQAPLLSQLPHWFPGGGLPSDTPLVMEEYGQQCGPYRKSQAS